MVFPVTKAGFFHVSKGIVVIPGPGALELVYSPPCLPSELLCFNWLYILKFCKWFYFKNYNAPKTFWKAVVYYILNTFLSITLSNQWQIFIQCIHQMFPKSVFSILKPQSAGPCASWPRLSNSLQANTQNPSYLLKSTVNQLPSSLSFLNKAPHISLPCAQMQTKSEFLCWYVMPSLIISQYSLPWTYH